jgi:type I restriction enzyme S subunit
MYTILAPHDPTAFDGRFFDYLAQRAEMRHAAYVSSNGFFAERLRLNFDPRDFLRRKIIIPPTLAEQQMIAAVLATADREIDLLEQQLAALREQKRSLMQRLLTGEVRVKVSPKAKKN